MQLANMRISYQKLTNYLLCVLFLIPFLIPRGVTELLSMSGGGLAQINTLFSYGRIAVILAGAVLLIAKRIVPSPITIAYNLFYIYIICVCLIRGTDTTTTFNEWIPVLGFSLILEYFNKEDLSVFLNTILFLLGLTITINFATLIIFPDTMYIDFRGWTSNWFLGFRNSHIYTYLPWLIIMLIKSYQKHGKLTWTMIALIGCFVWSISAADSATSLVVIIVFLVLCIFALKIGKLPVPNVRVVLVLVAALSYAIIVLRIQERFADVLSESLNRDAVTFTGRTVIWANFLKKFTEHPILGNGYYDFNMSGWVVTSAHNTLLDILASGGIVGFLIFCSSFVIVGKQLQKVKKQPYKKILLIGLISYLVEFLTERYQLPHLLFLTLFMAYHMDRIIFLYPLKREKRKVVFTRLHTVSRH